jgi:hypothetical protein
MFRKQGKKMENNKSLWIIGITGIILACCLVTLLTAIGQLAFQLQPSDVFTLGQLSVELILIPTVIVGFIATIIQFRASQETAKPQLYWKTKTGNFVKSIDLTIPQAATSIVQTPRLVMKNEGVAVTTWYLVQFEITKEIYLENTPRMNRLIGENINSSIDDSHWHFDSSTEKQIWSFMSNGKYALYPNYAQELGEINIIISGEEKYPESCTIPFVIYSDKGKETKGELKINFTMSGKS